MTDRSYVACVFCFLMSKNQLDLILNEFSKDFTGFIYRHPSSLRPNLQCNVQPYFSILLFLFPADKFRIQFRTFVQILIVLFMYVIANPINCTGQWLLGSCSVSCGDGFMSETFSVISPETAGGMCEAADNDTRTALCNNGDCRTDPFSPFPHHTQIHTLAH